MKLFKKTLLFLSIFTFTSTCLLASPVTAQNDDIALLQEIDSTITADNTEILDINDLSEFEQKELQEHIAEQESEGFTLDKVIVYSTIDDDDDRLPKGASNTSLSANGISKHNITEYYTSPTETLNSSKYGMSYWLDVTWNLAIGSYTKYAWKAATILGINPSNFYTSYQKGDSLKSTYEKVYTHTYYRKEDPYSHEQLNYLRTSKLALTNYIDLYTIDKNNNAYRDSNSQTKYYYTENYFDNAYIVDTVNYNCSTGNSVCWIDRF